MPGFPALHGSSLLIVVLWIVGTPLPLQFARQPLFGLVIRRKFGAERFQTCRPLLRDKSNGDWTKVKSNRVVPKAMLGFQVGHTFQSKLRIVAVAFPISPLGI